MTDAPTGNARNGHKIVVIDGHALAFRSYYAIRDLSNSRGETTNAVYGFLRLAAANSSRGGRVRRDGRDLRRARQNLPARAV